MRNVPILDRRRIRRIDGSFGFIPHRFLNDGFFASLAHNELVLYFFLILASDRFGMSWYGDKALHKHTGIDSDDLDDIRRGLESKALIAFSTPFAQVLELPGRPISEKTGETQHPVSRILKSLQGDTQ